MFRNKIGTADLRLAAPGIAKRQDYTNKIKGASTGSPLSAIGCENLLRIGLFWRAAGCRHAAPGVRAAHGLRGHTYRRH